MLYENMKNWQCLINIISKSKFLLRNNFEKSSCSIYNVKNSSSKVFINCKNIRYNYSTVLSRHFRQSLTRFANQIRYSSQLFSRSSSLITHKYSFNMDDYSIIGFDLDGTILRYNLDEMVPLEYYSIAKYLVDVKHYPREILKPIDCNDMDFMQKGLILDSCHGNLLKLNSKGDIIKASHGTYTFLTDDEISETYGPEKRWKLSSQFIEDPLSTWNGPNSEKMRALLDYFDIPSSLVMARAVDAINENTPKNKTKKYDCYPDMLEALIQLYKRENFAECSSDYFEALKSNPQKYILKTSGIVIKWLKELKKTKAIFLLTGSNIDFANLTASYALGPDWRNLFDVVVTFARKPGFFIENRPFLKVENNSECLIELSEKDLELKSVYSQGNWKSLEKLLKTKFQDTKLNHKSVYVGDNLIQDVYTPSKYCNMDTIAIVEELLSDDQFKDQLVIEKFLNITSSEHWDSYFYMNKEKTFWKDIVDKHAKICVPTVDYLCKT